MAAITEIEISLIVTDKPGVLVFLRSQAEEKVTHITFDYFERPGDESFYARIERREGPTSTNWFLTAKGSFQKQDGIDERQEVTLKLNEQEVEDCKLFLAITGLETRGTKSKRQHAFQIDNLHVTIDEWSVAELGDRLEIEGTDKAKIKEFASRLTAYCTLDPAK